MMNAIKAIIFDLDGTLIHSAPDIQFASNAALRTINRDPLDIETIISFIGNGSEVLVDRFVEFTGGGSETLKRKVFTTFMNVYEENVTTLTKPYPGVIDALSGFKARGIKLGICTNKPNDLANKPKKPDPYLLKSCVNAMECNLDEIAYVGDSTIDFDTAMNASINFYLFSGGYLNRPYPNFHKCIQFNDWKNININYNT